MFPEIRFPSPLTTLPMMLFFAVLNHDSVGVSDSRGPRGVRPDVAVFDLISGRGDSVDQDSGAPGGTIDRQSQDCGIGPIDFQHGGGRGGEAGAIELNQRSTGKARLALPPLIVICEVMAGKAEVSEISLTPAPPAVISKLIVFAPPAAFESRIAWRKLPAPLFAVLMMVKAESSVRSSSCSTEPPQGLCLDRAAGRLPRRAAMCRSENLMNQFFDIVSLQSWEISD